MELAERTSILYRIMQGKISCKFLNNRYYILYPNIDILYESQLLYDDIIEDNKYKPWLKLSNCKKHLEYNGIWKKSMDDELAHLIEELENTKVQIYKSFFNKKEYSRNKIILTDIIEKINNLENTLHSLDHMTLEGFASYCKDTFILQHTIIDSNNNKLENLTFKTLDFFRKIKYSNNIATNIYRELTRTTPWLDYWGSHKANIFDTKGVNLTDEQRTLILYSNMYDSIHNSPDCPCKAIIEDDDALDGWIIHTNKEREKEKNEKNINTTTGIPDSAQEVFLPASTEKEAKAINDLNTIETKMIKKQRNNLIKEKGQVEDHKLPDKQLELRRMLIDKISQGVKHG